MITQLNKDPSQSSGVKSNSLKNMVFQEGSELQSPFKEFTPSKIKLPCSVRTSAIKMQESDIDLRDQACILSSTSMEFEKDPDQTLAKDQLRII